MKIVVAYIFPLNARQEYQADAGVWLKGYLANRPKIEHSTVVSFSGGEPVTKDTERFAVAESLWDLYFKIYPGEGWDIGHYQHLSREIPCDLMVFMGTRTEPKHPQWLELFASAYLKHGPKAIYGASASLESACEDAANFRSPNPHIRTTCFAVNPEVFNRYPYNIATRQDCHAFESGAWNVTRWYEDSGYKALMVAVDGIYAKPDWRKPANIFRRGNQSNCIVWDRHHRIFRDATPEKKRELAKAAGDL